MNEENETMEIETAEAESPQSPDGDSLRPALPQMPFSGRAQPSPESSGGASGAEEDEAPAAGAE